MSEDATAAATEASAPDEGGEDEEDLEKLQKEIERMEAEAARITKETDDLEKQNHERELESGYKILIRCGPKTPVDLSGNDLEKQNP